VVPTQDARRAALVMLVPSRRASQQCFFANRVGDLRIVITDAGEIPFTSPIDRLSALPTLGELQHTLDHTNVGGEVYGVGHPTRENNHTEHREERRCFLTIRSPVDPPLEELDRSRLEQWIARAARTSVSRPHDA